MSLLSNWLANTKRVQAKDKITNTVFEFESVFPDGAPDGTPFSAAEMNKIITAINGLEIQSGSNTKGNWIKYPDGIMICAAKETKVIPNADGVWLEFPNSFIADGAIATVTHGNYTNPWIVSVSGVYKNSLKAYVRTGDGSLVSNQSITLSAIIIGRWK